MKQTVYKKEIGYYDIQKAILIKNGYAITKDTSEYSIFEK
jgi:hypothetical protein